jgi:hypothetical protein
MGRTAAESTRGILRREQPFREPFPSDQLGAVESSRSVQSATYRLVDLDYSGKEKFAFDIQGLLLACVQGLCPSAMAGFFSGFPDVHAVEQELIESGDTVTPQFIV